MQDTTRPDSEVPGNVPRKEPNSPITGIPRGERLRSELDSISSRTRKLEGAMALPEVKADGSSECPWAEDLYAKKEKLEVQVGRDAEQLKHYLIALEGEIQRCRANLSQIQTGGSRLHVPETSRHYSEAEEAQQRQLQSAVDDKEAVLVVLTKAQAVLQVARTRKFPGRKPQEGSVFPMPGLGGPASTSIRSSPGQPGNELGGLTSLGPLGSP